MIVVYLTSTTLNGFIADSNDSLEWLFAVDATESPDHEAFVETIGAQVMGANTYDWLINNQGLMDQPEVWQSIYGNMPVFVLTNRTFPVPHGMNVTFISGDIMDHAATLASSTNGKNLWIVGGGDVAAQFLDAQILDEIVIQVAPAALASGKPLFPRDLGAEQLTLKDMTRFGNFAQLTYEVSYEASAE